MKPEVDRVLEIAAITLMAQVGPALSTKYAQSNAISLGILFLMLREEFDRSAARRVDENEAIREIFGSALGVVAEAGLRGRLASESEQRDADFRISGLEAANARLRELLIELHVYVEGLDSPEAQEVDAAIWRELALSTERRKLSLAAA